jgi:hypothetical protein
MPDLLRLSGSSFQWHALSRPELAIARFQSTPGTLDSASLQQTNHARLFPLGVRTSTMQKLKEPFGPGSAAGEGLLWLVSAVYHGNQHLTGRCSELSGGVAFSDHSINFRQPVR